MKGNQLIFTSIISTTSQETKMSLDSYVKGVRSYILENDVSVDMFVEKLLTTTPQKSSRMKDVFEDGQWVLHTIINKNDTWAGQYSFGSIYHNNIAYKSISSFAKAHYAQAAPHMFSNANGWKECQVFTGLGWIDTDQLRPLL